MQVNDCTPQISITTSHYTLSQHPTGKNAVSQFLHTGKEKMSKNGRNLKLTCSWAIFVKFWHLDVNLLEQVDTFMINIFFRDNDNTLINLTS